MKAYTKFSRWAESLLILLRLRRLHGHRGLPRAFFQICGTDPLRDEGLYRESLNREDFDIETKLLSYPGFGHMFWPNYRRMKKK